MADGSCFALVNGRRMRLTKVDNCGRPVAGQCSQVVTSGFVTATLSPEIDEGEEITVKNAAGETCVSRPPCPTKKWTNAEIEFCEVDVELFAMLNPKWRIIRNAAGIAIGVAMGRDFTCDGGFALEIWTDTEGDLDVCDNPDAEGAWGYLLLPWMTNGAITGDVAVANDAITFTMSAKSKIKSRWGSGPYDVMLDAATPANPAPLFEPVEGWQDMQLIIVDVAPPEPQCGCQPLDYTTPPAATGATAGNPGFFTPTPSAQPSNIGALAGVVAEPATPWVDGQHVRTYAGDSVWWNGTAWVIGEAPAAAGPITATGATAGTPGTFTPAGASPPADLTAMDTLAATPNTPWASGEYVDLADASTAYWSGSDWQPGTAP